MYTVIREKDGTTNTIRTQEYSVGTYVIINDDPSTQYGVCAKEAAYHIMLRENAIKRGATLVEGNYIDNDNESSINKFEKAITLICHV